MLFRSQGLLFKIKWDSICRDNTPENALRVHL